LEAELAFAQRAEDAGNFGAADGAHDRANKLLGYYVEKHEVHHLDPADVLKQIAEISPEIAQQLAQLAGIDWPTRELGQVRLIAPSKARKATDSAE